MRRWRVAIGVALMIAIVTALLLTRSSAPDVAPADAGIPEPELVFGSRNPLFVVLANGMDGGPRTNAVFTGEKGRLTVLATCDGQPLAGVVVTAWNVDDEFDVISDEDGRAQFELPPGSWDVRAALEGYDTEYVSSRPTITIVEHGEPLEFSLEFYALGWIEGIVTNEGGVPLGGAVVNQSFSDDAGHFRSHIKSGEAETLVFASLEGYLPWSESLTLDGGPVHIVLVRAPEVGSSGPVSGLVLDSTGERVSGAFVTCSRDDFFETAFTSDEGAFTVVCPSPSRIHAWGKGESEPIDVKAGDTVTLRLAPRRTISGRAVDENGLPVTRVRLVVKGQILGEAVTSDGAFTFKELDATVLEARFASPAFAREIVRELDLRERDGNLGQLVFKRGNPFRGVVVDADDHAIAAASVKGSGADVRADAKGRFELWLDPTQRVELTIARPGFMTRSVWLMPSAGETRILLSRATGGETREFGGVGLSLSRELGADGYQVLAVVEKSPASEAGLRTDDFVTSVDGVAAGTFATADDFHASVRGPEGTVVRLGIRRFEQSFDVRITRRRIVY